MLKRFAVVFLLLLVFCRVQANDTCYISASSQKRCLGDITLFTPTIVSSKTIAYYRWNFGGGQGTSTQMNPAFKYTATGTFVPTLLVKFTDSSSCSSTGLPVRVFALPIASFVNLSGQTLCFKNNKLCLQDFSTPGASSAPLMQRLFLFGDGASDNTTPSFGSVVCHSYTNSFGGLYTLVLEVTDTNGCVSRVTKKDSVTLYAQSLPTSFSTNYQLQCTQTPVKFTNTSQLPKNQVASFRWNFGDGSPDNTTNWDSLTHIYTKTGTFDAYLATVDVFGCRDTFFLKNAGANASLNALIKVDPGTQVCFRQNKVTLSSTNPAAPFANTLWEIFDVTRGNKKIDSLVNPFDPTVPGCTHCTKFAFPNCGQFRVELKAYVGSCVIKKDTLIDVFGPNAVIQVDSNKARTINQNQCSTKDTVFFVTPIPYLSCHYGNTRILRVWDFKDLNCPPCTTDTKRGLNVGVNCRWSVDSINIWHYYGNNPDGCYFPTLLIYDSTTGCWDGDTTALKLQKPNAKPDTLNPHVRRGLYFKGTPCLNSPITFMLDEVLPQCGWDSAWIMFDSACGPRATWDLTVPVRTKITGHTYDSTCDKSGWVTVGLIIKNGQCYDTGWYHHMFRMLPINPNVTFTKKGICAPYELTFTPVDSIQDSLTRAVWQFMSVDQFGNLFYYPPIVQNMNANGDTIHPVTVNRGNGFFYVQLTLTNIRGCKENSFTPFVLGYYRHIRPSKQYLCAGEEVQIFDSIRYYNASGGIVDSAYWSDINRNNAGKEFIWWDLDDGKGVSKTGSNPKIKFNQAGNYSVRLITRDSMGCMDTITWDDLIRVVEIHAGIKVFDTVAYCVPYTTQFFDSTTYIDSASKVGFPYFDQIGSYEWSFGDNLAKSSLKNPFANYNAMNGLKTVTLKVKTQSFGCVDSITRQLMIKGPDARFDIISDTIGCAPFTVLLKNTTGRQILRWIWAFGDSAKTNFTTTKDTNVYFTYNKSGKYSIRLSGYEVIYNPKTNTTRTCENVFPDTVTGIPTRDVYVYPTPSASIIGPDSICPNNPAVFYANASPIYNKFKWSQMDSSYTVISKSRPDTSVILNFNDIGVFTIQLAPQPISTTQRCIDTAYKTVFVSGIKSDFDLIDSRAPIYSFINKSSANAIKFEWYKGTDVSNANNIFSFNKDAEKDFTSDTGVVLVCLKAYNSDGCWDTTCKPTNRTPRLTIPNVFTPDNNDNVNDAFDIDIAGYTKYQLDIYNRWGTKVFEGSKDGVGNDGTNWNGREYNNGSYCPSGTYFYIFKYKMINELSEKTVNGTITLIRTE